MAASTSDKDYVHILEDKLAKDREFSVKCLNFAAWEITAHDRYQVLQQLDSYLYSDLELVVIQLGENMSDIHTADSDFEALLQYIQNRCAKAEIYVLGNFWTNDELDALKEQASVAVGATYISLKELQSTEYQARLGTIVYGENGEPHIIDHEGVAQHPGDVGMLAIANKIYEAYSENRRE